MKNIKGLEELKEQLMTFEQDITESIRHELERIDRSVTMDEFSIVPFSEELAPYVTAIQIDDGEPILITSFADTKVKLLSACISDSEVGNWDLIALLETLKYLPKVKPNKYIFKGKGNNVDVAFTLEDLIPIAPSNGYDYNKLVRLINNTHYDTDWQQPMNEEYDQLYSRGENKKVNFFKIKGTAIIVMPGMYVYPTILTEADVKNYL